jgi:hypothetical protein
VILFQWTKLFTQQLDVFDHLQVGSLLDSFKVWCNSRSKIHSPQEGKIVQFKTWKQLLTQTFMNNDPKHSRLPHIQGAQFFAQFLSGSQGMSRMLTFMLTSSPKLTKMFCICKCFFLMCSTLVLSFLLFGVGFELNLASFWGYLKFILHALICVIGSLKPFMTKSNKLFIYPLTKLFKIWWTNQHNSFSSCCHVGVYTIIEEVVKVNKRFLLTLEGLW